MKTKRRIGDKISQETYVLISWKVTENPERLVHFIVGAAKRVNRTPTCFCFSLCLLSHVGSDGPTWLFCEAAV